MIKLSEMLATIFTKYRYLVRTTVAVATATILSAQCKSLTAHRRESLVTRRRFSHCINGWRSSASTPHSLVCGDHNKRFPRVMGKKIEGWASRLISTERGNAITPAKDRFVPFIRIWETLLKMRVIFQHQTSESSTFRIFRNDISEQNWISFFFIFKL